MRHHRHTPTRTAPVITLHDADETTAADIIETAQLRRLAATVLSKSPEDLAALAETNPLLVWEWIDAFRKEKLAAEAEARYWSAAAAALSTATPHVVRAAAE
ncbi:MAG TPA: hypothetical protein PK857_08015 [Hyphomicrobium sp.]|nr:hypothetical protein [Hyphomicrobium sp.]HRO49291.1 hypothetical protein [Hyphomicrobium sp.]